MSSLRRALRALNDSPPSPELLAEYIERDPASWSRVSLFYARPCDEYAVGALAANRVGTLLLRGKDNCLVLGAETPPAVGTGEAAVHLWIPDIACEWVQAHSIVRNMAHLPPALIGPQGAHPRTTVSPSILVVGRDPLISGTVEHHLRRYGIVILTSTAREAIAEYNVCCPDLVFLDVRHEDDYYEGLDVLMNLRSADEKAFVVMMSGDCDPAMIAKAMALGAQGFIGAPFHASKFAYYLDKFLLTRNTA